MKFFERFTQVAQQSVVRRYILRHARQVGCLMNDKLHVIGSLLTKHCEFIATQRIRRACQICVLYRQIYNDSTIKNMAYEFAARYGTRWRNCCKTRFGMLLGAAFFSWDKDGISEDELKRCSEDLESVTNTLEVVNFKFSACNSVSSKWDLVINRENLKVWRKPISNSYLYEYKVYGTFYDIPAKAFFEVQLDVQYRKKWDKLVISLDTVDRDDRTGSEVVHWVMHYPFPMYSREYVYIRRAHIDPVNRVMVLVSKATTHPACPISSHFVRVSQYSSSMVIKPHNDFDTNGFDYVLTYFDDPQAMIPSPAYSWMATSGVPEFVEKLHQAAIILNHEQIHTKNESDYSLDQQITSHQSKSDSVSRSATHIPHYA